MIYTMLLYKYIEFSITTKYIIVIEEIAFQKSNLESIVSRKVGYTATFAILVRIGVH